MKYLITGCSRGIGKALLIELLNNEHQVISISRTKTKIDNEITTPLIEWHEIVGSITDESVHKELAKLLNQLDSQGREDDAIIVETEMDFRYETSYKNELLNNN